MTFIIVMYQRISQNDVHGGWMEESGIERICRGNTPSKFLPLKSFRLLEPAKSQYFGYAHSRKASTEGFRHLCLRRIGRDKFRCLINALQVLRQGETIEKRRSNRFSQAASADGLGKSGKPGRIRHRGLEFSGRSPFLQARSLL